MEQDVRTPLRAWEKAYTEHRVAVYHTALSFIRDRDAAEDVCHEVFLALYGEWEKGGRIRHLRAWLLTATRNRCANLMRDRRREELTGDDGVWDIPAEDDDDTEAEAPAAAGDTASRRRRASGPWTAMTARSWVTSAPPRAAWMRAVSGPRAAQPGSGWGVDDVADIAAVVPTAAPVRDLTKSGRRRSAPVRDLRTTAAGLPARSPAKNHPKGGPDRILPLSAARDDSRHTSKTIFFHYIAAASVLLTAARDYNDLIDKRIIIKCRYRTCKHWHARKLCILFVYAAHAPRRAGCDDDSSNFSVFIHSDNNLKILSGWFTAGPFLLKY